MDEEVGVVPRHVPPKVVFQAADRAVAVLPVFSGQGVYCLDVFSQLLWNFCKSIADDLVLLIPSSVGGDFTAGQGSVLKGNGDGIAISVPFRLGDTGNEESAVAFDVVLLHVGVLEAKLHRHAVGRLPVIVAESARRS